MNDLNVFSKDGTILPDINPDEVAALDDADRAVLEQTLLACRAAEDAEEFLAETRKKLYAAMKAHDAAVKADREANPPVTHVEAARAVMHANNPNLPKPLQRKPDKKAATTLAEAVQVLTTLQGDTLIRAETAARTASRARGAAISEWIRTQRGVITPLDQARDYANRSTELRAANVKAGLPAEGAKVEKTSSCELERVMQERGKPKQVRTPASNKAFPGSGMPKVRAF